MRNKVLVVISYGLVKSKRLKKRGIFTIDGVESVDKGMECLDGYTSGEAGIRHALLEQDSVVNMEEARFMLITCSAFVNYLISKS